MTSYIFKILLFFGKSVFGYLDIAGDFLQKPVAQGAAQPCNKTGNHSEHAPHGAGFDKLIDEFFHG